MTALCGRLRHGKLGLTKIIAANRHRGLKHLPFGGGPELPSWNHEVYNGAELRSAIEENLSKTLNGAHESRGQGRRYR